MFVLHAIQQHVENSQWETVRDSHRRSDHVGNPQTRWRPDWLVRFSKAAGSLERGCHKRFEERS